MFPWTGALCSPWTACIGLWGVDKISRGFEISKSSSALRFKVVNEPHARRFVHLLNFHQDDLLQGIVSG